MHAQTLSRSITTLMLLAVLFNATAQVAAYIPPDFKGEAPSSNGCFIRNQGQLRTLQETAASQVTAYSMQFVPQLFVEKDNVLSVALGTRDTVLATVDTIVKFNIEFFGPNLNTQSYISLHEPLDERYNFVLGHLSSPLMGLISYKRLIYRDVYPNIDVHIYSNQWGPKLYMVMKPGADPTDLRMRFNGQDSLIMDAFGFLRPYIEGRYIILPKGLCYQEIDGNLVMVQAQLGYQLNTGTAEVNFQPVSYNNAYPLIIDISASLGPQGGGDELIPPKWATYDGHTENDRASDGTVLPNGGLLVVGTTYSPAYPLWFAQFGNFDGSRMAYVTEFDGLYERKYTTFFGGNGVDNGNSITLAPGGGSFYLFGETTSTNLQLTDPGNGAFMDNTPQLYNCYIAKFSRANVPATPAEWVTYFGAGMQSCSCIRTASNGEVYILGDTRAFGPSPDPETTCQGTTGTFPICNQLGSSAFIQTYPNSSNDADAYFCRFNADLNLVQSTFFGGSSTEHGNKIAVDNANQRVYILGTTNSTRQSYTNCQPTGGSFPLCNQTGSYFQQNLNGTNSQNGGLHFDAYIASFAQNGALDWSTFFGGWHTENGFAITLNPINQSIYIGGFSQTSFGYSTNNCLPPTTNGFPSCALGTQEQFPFAGGEADAYVARFNLTDRSLKWSTFLGRGGIDQLSAMGWDEGGNVWLGGITQGGGAASGAIPLATLNGVYYQDVHGDEGSSEVKYDGMFYSFTPSDVLRHGSYFGGRGNEDVRIMAASAGGQLYMGGSSGSDQDFPFACPPTPNPYCYLTYATLLPGTTESFYTDLRHGTAVGIFESSTAGQSLHVYPNPANGSLFVSLPDQIRGSVSLRVFDALGKAVKSMPVTSARGSSPLHLDAQDLPPGLHLIRLDCLESGYSATSSFILE